MNILIICNYQPIIINMSILKMSLQLKVWYVKWKKTKLVRTKWLYSKICTRMTKDYKGKQKYNSWYDVIAWLQVNILLKKSFIIKLCGQIIKLGEKLVL